MNKNSVQDTFKEMERAERNYKIAFYAAFVAESLMLVTMMLLMNFKDKLHLLLLIGFVGSYTIIIFALFVLGAHVSRVGQRIIRAINLGLIDKD
ncbi:MAG: hypothetical protein FJW32_27680 [Acidobacteria bacterium]|nr:hypothetical protein [Acidobacteriota bacterium]